ncbi:MAG: hypothetical protein GY861_25855, partial [bacterium]|nr:hypothetical protein [bacterium]
YATLSLEECFGEGEFLESWKKGDHEGVLDGIADMCFTVMQWNVLNGDDLTMKDEWIVKDLLVQSEEHLVEDLCRAIETKNHMDSITYLVALLKFKSKEYDIVGVFNRVHKSNLSKAVHVKSGVDTDKEVDYILSQGRYEDITVVKSGDYLVFKAGRDSRSGVVFDKAKVIKSRQFVDVQDLGGLLEFVY